MAHHPSTRLDGANDKGMGMTGIEISRVGDTVDLLGEGLLWDAASETLFWVDALGGIVHRLSSDGAHEALRTDAPIGTIFLAEPGSLLISLQDGIYSLDLATGRTVPVAVLPDTDPELRFNDGVIDRQGRLLCGQMHIRPPADPSAYRGVFCRLEGAGLAVIEQGIGVTNGPCFSPDARTFYLADSPRKTIWAYDHDPDSGALSQRRVFADVAVLEGSPDGGTVDADGCVWSAIISAGTVVRLTPDGRPDRRIQMPIRYPTNVGFGGAQNDVLYVTSLSRSVNFAATEDGAGGLFAIHGLGVTGLPDVRFRPFSA